MKAVGFDNDKYLETQSKHISERISMFDNKLYLEMGGKLFDDFHASRVLPGFQPDSKMKMMRYRMHEALRAPAFGLSPPALPPRALRPPRCR